MSKNYPEKEVDLKAKEESEYDYAEEVFAPARVFSRILAVLLALAPIALLCFLPVTLALETASADSASIVFTNKTTLLKAFIALFKKDGLATLYGSIGTITAAGESINLASVVPAKLSYFQGIKFIPYLNSIDKHAMLYSLFLYAIPLTFVLNVVFMIVGVSSGKKAPAMVRTISYMNLIAIGGYALVTLWLSSMYDKATFDYVVLGIAGGSLLLYVLYSFGKNKSKVVVPFILFLLTVAFVGAFAFPYLYYNKQGQSFMNLYSLTLDASKSFIKSQTWGVIYKWVIRCAFGLLVLALYFSTARLPMKKGYGFDIFRYILNFIVAVLILLACFIDFKFTGDVNESVLLKQLRWYAVAAVSIALLQIVICVAVKVTAKKNAAALEEECDNEETEEEEEEKEDVQEETTPATETTPAPAPAPVYANGYGAPIAPIAPVPMYVPVYTPTPAVAPAPAPVVTPAPVVEEEEDIIVPNFSSYKEEEEEAEVTPVAPVEQNVSTPTNAATTNNYYATQNFDPFIASLTDKEREQFTTLFVLKYNGVMNNIPDYVVGGNNDDFFRKVFIYLGQYRDRIPDGLLAKIYKFAVRK